MEAKQQQIFVCVIVSLCRVCAHRWLDFASSRAQSHAPAPTALRTCAFRGRVHGSQGQPSHVECQAAPPTLAMVNRSGGKRSWRHSCMQMQCSQRVARDESSSQRESNAGTVPVRGAAATDGSPAEVHVHAPRPAGRLGNLHAPQPKAEAEAPPARRGATAM